MLITIKIDLKTVKEIYGVQRVQQSNNNRATVGKCTFFFFSPLNRIKILRLFSRHF